MLNSVTIQRFSPLAINKRFSHMHHAAHKQTLDVLNFAFNRIHYLLCAGLFASPMPRMFTLWINGKCKLVQLSRASQRIKGKASVDF